MDDEYMSENFSQIEARMADVNNIVVTRGNIVVPQDVIWSETLTTIPEQRSAREIDVDDTIKVNGQDIKISTLVSAYTNLHERCEQLDRIEEKQDKILRLLEKAVSQGNIPNLQELLR